MRTITRPNVREIKKARVSRAQLFTSIRRSLMLTIGVAIVVLGYVLFQVPHDIAAGGLSGIGIIINHFTGWSLGALYLILNVPLIILGYFYLGRWPFVFKTMIAALLFSLLTDVALAYLPGYLDHYPITDDLLLSSIYGGVIGGIGGGLIYRAGATMGGTGIIGRIIQMKTGTPLSQVYLYTDGVIVLTAGIVFGWEIALYAMLTLLLAGMASDYVLEGPSRARTATIVTDHPEPMVEAIITELGRGVSYWEATGGYSGTTRTIMMCTIYRSQLGDLKQVVERVDPNAFVSIGVTQQAMGEGFLRIKG